MAATVIEHRPQQQQFVLALENGPCATVNYRKQDGKLYLIHAEVPSELRGHRVGKELVEKTFEYIETHGWQAVAVCSYVKLVARRSRKWRDIIQ
ncbi:GNAT family N-acetyltransferase [Spongiibacter sp.]|uniref:GNAT family N-acetyltransferase n=1 Tax=Spongiibacter sp. TaxID=2024860 RepID=UPI003566FB00